MPELSRFYGIVIRMYFGHLTFTLSMRRTGRSSTSKHLPFSVDGSHRVPLGLVAEWAALHQEELRQAWQKAKKLEPAGKIDPLP